MAYTQTDLTVAQTALEKRLLGTQVTQASQGDESYRFNEISIPELRSLVREMQVELGQIAFVGRTYAKNAGRTSG